MNDFLRFTILGCGSSPGVPRIGGDWGACDPSNPKNRRRRCSLLAQRVSRHGHFTNVLIDTSPDLREQALSAGIGTLDGVLFTHSHADHIHGIDDLRGFVMNMQRRIDVYADDDDAWRGSGRPSAIASKRRPAANIRRSRTRIRSAPASR